MCGRFDETDRAGDIPAGQRHLSFRVHRGTRSSLGSDGARQEGGPADVGLHLGVPEPIGGEIYLGKRLKGVGGN